MLSILADKPLPSTSVALEPAPAPAPTKARRKPGRQIIEMAPGHTYGPWTVLAPAKSRVYGRGKSATAMWLCRCSCGTEAVVAGVRLRDGTSGRCSACSSRSVRPGRPKVEMRIGQRCGKWTVTGPAPSRVDRSPKGRRSTQAMWAVTCDCGNTSTVSGISLRTGSSRQCRSCGYRSAAAKMRAWRGDIQQTPQ